MLLAPNQACAKGFADQVTKGTESLTHGHRAFGAEQLQSTLHLASGFHCFHFCCLRGLFPASHLAREEPCMQSTLLISDPSFDHEK